MTINASEQRGVVARQELQPRHFALRQQQYAMTVLAPTDMTPVAVHLSAFATYCQDVPCQRLS